MATGSLKKRDLMAEAKKFCDSLSNVFMHKKRDPQTQHLLEQAKALIEALVSENQKYAVDPRSSSPRGTSRSGGGMGQLWVKLDELKRENEALRKKREKLAPGEKPPIPAKPVTGPGEVIISDLNKTKKDNEVLRTKVDKLQNTLKEMEAIQYNLQDEYRRAKVAVETTQKSMETVLKDYKQMEVNLTSAKTENDSLKQKLTKSVKPMMRADNRLVENISEKCRPSNIALSYDSLESQAWMDAKEALEETTDFEEDDIVQFLCACVMSAFHSSKEVYDVMKATIAELLRKPTLAMSKSFIGQSNGKSKLPDDMTDSVGQQLRQHFDEIDTEVIVCATTEKLTLEFTEFIARQAHENKHVRLFMHQCARITWQMIIQQPPMYLSVDDSLFSADQHKLWWSCDSERANEINYFIWPCLFDYKRGNLLIKGCVHAS